MKNNNKSNSSFKLISNDNECKYKVKVKIKDLKKLTK